MAYSWIPAKPWGAKRYLIITNERVNIFLSYFPWLLCTLYSLTSMYQIFDSSSLWPVSLVKRFPNLVAFADRGQLQTVPWSFPEESYWDLIFSERCSLQSMSGPLSHLGTPIGPVAMALYFSPSTARRFLKRWTAALCLFSATLLLSCRPGKRHL